MRTLVVFFFIVFCTVRVSGQESKQRIKWLTGTVLNSKQQPVKKAIIYLDSVKTKIKTDKKGQFKIGLIINIFLHIHGIMVLKLLRMKEVMSL